jgi:hypothetical protein
MPRVILVSLVLCWACGGSNPDPTWRPIELPRDGAGWSNVARLDEAAVRHVSPEGSVALACREGRRSLDVAAAFPEMTKGAWAGDPGVLSLGLTAFEATPILGAAGEATQLTAELTDQLLDALRRAHNVRVTQGGSVLGTSSDGADALRAFADKCAALMSFGQ